jgi:hypothetical protein
MTSSSSFVENKVQTFDSYRVSFVAKWVESSVGHLFLFHNRRVDILILFSDHIGYQYQYEKIGYKVSYKKHLGNNHCLCVRVGYQITG